MVIETNATPRTIVVIVSMSAESRYKDRNGKCLHHRDCPLIHPSMATCFHLRGICPPRLSKSARIGYADARRHENRKECGADYPCGANQFQKIRFETYEEKCIEIANKWAISQKSLTGSLVAGSTAVFNVRFQKNMPTIAKTISPTNPKVIASVYELWTAKIVKIVSARRP